MKTEWISMVFIIVLAGVSSFAKAELEPCNHLSVSGLQGAR